MPFAPTYKPACAIRAPEVWKTLADAEAADASGWGVDALRPHLQARLCHPGPGGLEDTGRRGGRGRQWLGRGCPSPPLTSPPVPSGPRRSGRHWPTRRPRTPVAGAWMPFAPTYKPACAIRAPEVWKTLADAEAADASGWGVDALRPHLQARLCHPGPGGL